MNSPTHFQLHGTYRRKDRIYSEDIFWGTGKALADASKAELDVDMGERVTENPLAYSTGRLDFALTEAEKAAAAKAKAE